MGEKSKTQELGREAFYQKGPWPWKASCVVTRLDPLATGSQKKLQNVYLEL